MTMSIVFRTQLMQVPNYKSTIITLFRHSFVGLCFLFFLFEGPNLTQIIAQSQPHESSAASKQIASGNCYRLSPMDFPV